MIWGHQIIFWNMQKQVSLNNNIWLFATLMDMGQRISNNHLCEIYAGNKQIFTSHIYIFYHHYLCLVWEILLYLTQLLYNIIHIHDN